MATIAEEMNSGLCQKKTAVGAESGKTCISQISATLSIITTGVNDVFSKDATFADEYARLIKKGTLDVLRGVNTFEENGGDDTTETLADGTEFLTNEGKYKFTAGFTNGMHFLKALASLSGFRNKRIMLVTKEGVWGTTDEDGNLIGFTTGMIQKGKAELGSFSAVQKEKLMFQFLERAELDEDFFFRKDANARKLKGVTQIAVSLVNTPADTDTTITAKLVYAQNQSEALPAVVFGQFINKVNGTTSNPTTAAESPTGTYALTVSAVSSGDKGELGLYDNAGNNAVIEGVDGDYYRSNTVNYTVV